MATLEFLKTKAIWSGCLAGALLLILFVNPVSSRAQAAAEAAGASAVSGGMGAAVSRSFPASLPTALPGPAVDPKLGYIAPSASGPPADVVNRKALEQRAGKGAAKLLLQSVPTAAAIYINGMFVGRAPLLLLVAPGSYKVAMRGPRDEFGERAVTVATSETQQVVLPLTQRYPVTVSATPKRAAPSTVVTTSGGVAGPVSSAGPDLQAKAAAAAAVTALAAGEENRKNFEQQAGKDAAKLVVMSTPSDALTYLDGMFVGRTPVLLVVVPGSHKIEMRGDRAEFGEQTVGVLPNETQQVALTLSLKYPAQITVP